MLKYIILQEPTGIEVARFGLAPTKHLDLALEAQAYQHGRRIVSAGFVEFVYVSCGSQPGHGEPFPLVLTARTYGRSDSLNLGPRSVDATFLTAFARATADLAAASIEQAAGGAVSGSQLSALSSQLGSK